MQMALSFDLDHVKRQHNLHQKHPSSLHSPIEASIATPRRTRPTRRTASRRNCALSNTTESPDLQTQSYDLFC